MGLSSRRHLLVETEMLHPHLEERERVSTGDVLGADETNNFSNLPSWWTGCWTGFIDHN